MRPFLESALSDHEARLIFEASCLQATLYRLSLSEPDRYKPAYFAAMRRWRRRMAMEGSLS